MKANIFIAGGGSGGHITPALAIAGEILKISPKSKMLFLCSRSELDKAIVRNGIVKLLNKNNDDKTVECHNANNKICYTPIFTGKLRRYFSLKNTVDIFKFIIGIFQSLYLLIKHKPKVVFSKGGYVGLTVGMAARILRIPIILHESDSIPGLSNKILAKKAKKILTTFPVNKKVEGKWRQAVFTGTPIRQNIIQGSRKNGLKILGFDNKNPILLVIGGSQGSMFLNELIKKTYKRIRANIILVCGKDKNVFETFNPEDAEKLRVFEFLGEEYGDILAASDLVISRSGSNSLAEIAATGKPSILVPLPLSANNHQLENAKLFTKENAAVLIKEDEIIPRKFASLVNKMLSNETQMEELSNNVKKFFHEDATRVIAQEILETAKL